MRSMDVSRSPDSLISYPRFPYHVPPARVFVCFLSISRVFLTCTNMDCRLVSGHLFVSRFSFCVVDSYTYVSRLRLSPFVSSTRLCLPLPLMPFLLQFVDSSPVSLFLDSDSLLSHFPFSYLCTCISHAAIYTGWRWDCSPSSIYFATTLKV